LPYGQQGLQMVAWVTAHRPLFWIIVALLLALLILAAPTDPDARFPGSD